MLFLLATLSVARAELPLPTYPKCGEVDRPDLCPDDLREYWPMISYIPSGSRSTVREVELTLGSGQWEDRAWRTTTGRFDVLLAICDSGINWASHSYQNKVALNTAELPLPQDANGVESTTYDLDGNGLVNIQDYAQDPRVSWDAGVDAADFQLDASDLIYTFSDGVDDDGNGFVDDIAGWDFYADDNDPYIQYTSGFGDHGDGVVEEMAAEGGDGDGDIGACPNCSVMMLRTGDTFVTDGARVSMALLYAVDRGAAAVNLSLGALTRPELMEQAVAYARERDIPLVSVAGDENAYHHNQPAMLDGMLYIHSVKANTDDERNGAYSYFNFLNCNNYGPRLDFVADTPACATGSAAITTGIIGLMKSAARDVGETLTSDEIYQILVATVDDVDLSPDEVARAATYPSGEGWDPFYGYGRVNAYRAVEAVVTGAIPPTVRVDSPRWFTTADPDGGAVVIDGRIAAPRSSSFTYVVEYGTGDDPRSWTTVTTGSGSGELDGTLATFDPAAVAAIAGPIPEPTAGEGILARMDRVFSPMVTLRVTVTDAEGRVGTLRRSIFVHHDDDLLPGFPLQMPASGESSPILADLDDDGIFEIVVADAGGRIHAYTGTGSELAGWPVQTDVLDRFHDGQAATQAGLGPLHDGFIATVAVGDLDGDGVPEVVAASGGGGLYVWHADGSPAAGFPTWIEGRDLVDAEGDDSWDNGYAGAPTLYDLDGDGTLEIIAAAMDQRLYVYDATGADFGPYPVEVCWRGVCGDPGARIIASATVGDVDGDGDPEILLGTNEAVNGGNDSVSYLLDGLTGTWVDGWPLAEGGLVNEAALLPIVGEGHPASGAFADLDHDGDLEIASPVMLGQNPLYDDEGNEVLDLSYVSSGFSEATNVAEPSFATMSNQPAFGDLTGDGVPDFVTGGTGTYYLIGLALFSAIDYEHVLAAWDGATGAMLPGYPRQIEDLQFLVAPAIADVTGDGKPEAIVGSGGYLVYAYDGTGALAPGWPKFTGNWVLGSAAVGDVDGDGYVEVVVTTREGYVYAWRTQGHADQAVQWASIHHDPQNTGNYETPLAVQAGPPDTDEDPPDDDGGGCCSGDKAAAVLWLPGLLFFASRRRRGAARTERA